MKAKDYNIIFSFPGQQHKWEYYLKDKSLPTDVIDDIVKEAVLPQLREILMVHPNTSSESAVYTVPGLIKLKFSSGNAHTIIEFDKDHHVRHTVGGVPLFFGPSSDKWDIETSDMFNEFIDNTLDKIDIIGDIFIF